MAREIERAAEETGLSQEEVLTQALALGLPRLRRQPDDVAPRLTTVEPPRRDEAAGLYALEEDDREQITRLREAQCFRATE